MLNLLLFFILLSAVTNISTAQDDGTLCDKPPKITPNVTCCDNPALFDGVQIDECYPRDSKDSIEELNCKGILCLFEKFKFKKTDGSLDKTVIEQFFDNTLKGKPEWLDVVKNKAIGQCFGMVEDNYAKMEELLKTLKMPSQCAAKPMIMSICISAKITAFCPDKFSSQDETCKKQKIFNEKCINTPEKLVQAISYSD
ncbi:uncharacterized protein LOC129758553 [Uranotaenia lowii]|uniref:uncharacterized protein LOC129758553 n=1 Tax=Uranotaenia lowii TaxID=190385 RepID=UPI0024793ECA|nr:uncharacterized protein LOC129758553 [Uranotaenia lowii]